MAVIIQQYGYDVEVLPNYFSITIVDISNYLNIFADCCDIKIKKGKEVKKQKPLVEKLTVKEIVNKLNNVRKWQFDITDYDDSQHLKLIKFINDLCPHKDIKGNSIITYMYGFNSGSYDKYMIACLLMYSGICSNVKELCTKLYETSKKIIELQNDKDLFFRDYYMKTLREYPLPYKDIDVMKIFALNKVGSGTNDKGEKVYFGKSLKQTSINIKWYELLEFELPPISYIDYGIYQERPRYKGLSIDELNNLINKWDRYMVEEYRKPMNHYNLNDVFIVCEMVRLYVDEIRLRYNLSRTYEIDVMNSSRSNIANILFKKFYSDFSGLRPEQWTGKKTQRTTMSFKRVIFDNIKFKTKQMQDFLESIRPVVLTSIGKDAFQRDITIGNLTYTMATGGLHSQDPPRKLVSKLNYIDLPGDSVWDGLSDDSYIYVHFDIASFYPSLMGVYRIAPEHLDAGVFTKLINWLKNTRVEAKHSKEEFIDGIPKDLLAQALKIVINSIYGKLGDENSDICDRLAVLKVTINGQLFILMLCEELEMNNIEVVSANTDGIVVKLYKKDKLKFDEITSNWLEITKLGADSELFSHYIDRDINNYLFKEIGKDPGYKGDFNPKLYIEDLQKGYNQPIVAQAVENYFLYDKPILETLYEATDILDFCKTQNIGKKFTVEFFDNAGYKEIQRNVRFYVSKSGGSLFKVSKADNYRGNLCAGYKVKVLNTLDDLPITERDIDYEYYYNEALKLIDPIMLGISPNQKGDKDKGIKSGKALLKKYGGGSYNTLFEDNDD